MKKLTRLLVLTIVIGIVIFLINLSNKNENNNLEESNTSKKTEVKEKIDKVNLTFVGDFLFEQLFYDAVSSGDDKNVYFSKVKKYFEDDDLSIGNMEVVIGNDELKVSGVGYNFCAPKWVGDLVNSLSMEVMSTANNHSYDRGHEGILSTLDYFSNTSIKTVGTRKNKEDNFYTIVEKNNIKFGIISYTYGTNKKASSEDRELINYYKDTSGNIDYDKLKSDVSYLKDNSDVVIVIMHWGIEFRYKPNDEQKKIAKYLNELGVDLIVGSHSHNISPIEVIGDEHKTLVYYSLGNFVSHDDDIARTPKGDEEFDNAYQVGLLSTLNVIKEKDKIKIEDIKARLIINYFDKNMHNFILVPYEEYLDYEKTHYRYSLGLNKDFINRIYKDTINSTYRVNYE